jgi:hypothetical protein
MFAIYTVPQVSSIGRQRKMPAHGYNIRVVQRAGIRAAAIRGILVLTDNNEGGVALETGENDG